MKGLQQFISGLYCRGAEVDAGSFRRWALTELRSLFEFDAAVWGTGTVKRPHFHTVTTFGVTSAFPRALEKTREINPLYLKLRENMGHPVDMRDAMPDEEFYGSELYERAFQPFGIERILSSGNVEPRSGLYTLLSLYRFDRERPFSDEERAVQDQILHHLIHASAHAFFLAISRPRTGSKSEYSAVCDAEGLFHEVEDGFLDLLEKNSPGWEGHVLPFALPAVGGSVAVGDLTATAEPLEDLFLVHLREAGPLDTLTERERDVVTQVCQGLSAKAIGRGLGLAPSTVSTHLYRAYRKLGVENRTALARLMQELQ